MFEDYEALYMALMGLTGGPYEDGFDALAPAAQADVRRRHTGYGDPERRRGAVFRELGRELRAAGRRKACGWWACRGWRGRMKAFLRSMTLKSMISRTLTAAKM